jgi:hypothetical protein
LTFEVDMDCDSSDNDNTHTDDSTEFIEGDTQTLIANKRKFIVFESQLDDLLVNHTYHLLPAVVFYLCS